MIRPRLFLLVLALLVSFAEASRGEDKLRAGTKLKAGDRLTCDKGIYTLYMQRDGSLVLYCGKEPDWIVVWSKRTAKAAPYLEVQATDGNLVLSGEQGGARLPEWNAGTCGYLGAYLVVQHDGNLVVLDATGSKALWSSGTVPDAQAALRTYEERQAEAKRLASPLGTGPGAYDGLVEPWRGRAAIEWRLRVEPCEEKVGEADLALGNAKKYLLDSEKELAEFIRKYGEKPEGSFLQDVLRNRKDKVAKAKTSVAQAEAALGAAKSKLDKVMKNDPPHLPEELAGCKTVGDVERRYTEIVAKERASDIAAVPVAGPGHPTAPGSVASGPGPVGGFSYGPKPSGPKTVHVSGYTTKNGTYVAPYTRSAPHHRK